MVTHVWKELDAAVAGRLAGASEGERAVFAAGVAQRLFQAHEALPAAEQRGFTLDLRPLLAAVWSGVLGDATAFATIKQGLGAFYLSDYCHNDGQDGPDDADEPAAAAVLHAANAYMHGCSDFAVFASGRAVEAVNELARDSEDHADDPDELLAEELRRQLRDLDLIAGHAATLRRARFGLDRATSADLRTALHLPLSRADDLT
ncbi:hypothetical protein ACFO3J_21265 [Streptomyces polygonati]|uniref:Uncharacterized protein n=1 Tax=Streptomyces polygonati TaxID=1617087 RepID=A0ABV8HUM7_9ACTN